MTNVYPTVKKNYKSAENLMLSATKAYLCCAFMEFSGTKSLDELPSNLKLPPHDSNKEIKSRFLKDTVRKFIDEYILVEFDIEKAWREEVEEKQAQSRIGSANTITKPNLASGITLYENI